MVGILWEYLKNKSNKWKSKKNRTKLFKTKIFKYFLKSFRIFKIYDWFHLKNKYNNSILHFRYQFWDTLTGRGYNVSFFPLYFLWYAFYEGISKLKVENEN